MPRVPLYDVHARRKTVSVTLNADLVAKATALGINISRTAEAALIKAFEEVEIPRIREELRQEAKLLDEFVAKYGLPFHDWTSDEEPTDGVDPAVRDDAA